MTEEQDPRLAWALVRYQVISPYLAADPPRGQREPLRRELAAKTWTGPDGEPLAVAAETIRTWVRRYRKRGLPGLMDQPRPVQGVQVLDEAQRELICALKREVPERSLDRLIKIAEETQLVSAGLLRRSTVHRVLRAAGLSRPPRQPTEAKDLDRFEAAFPNDLWQSDLLVGPWLPDPQRAGKVRRANLYAFLDDHSRLLLHGRFSFQDKLPSLELVFRRALQKYGLCRRVYYDNGKVYRADHMAEIVATLGLHRIVFTEPRRPEGHGKIEAFNRLIRASFLAELQATRITTLDALNEAFLAWGDDYNRTHHSEIGESPKARWQAGRAKIRYADDEDLRQAFTWKERRTPDKSGVFSLLGLEYQVGPELARREIQVRFDPEELHEIEIWHKGAFVQRVQPFVVRTHRRPKAECEDGQHTPNATSSKPAPQAAPTANWLGHLVEQRRREGQLEPSPRQLVEDARRRREQADLALLELLRARLDPDVLDEALVLGWLAQYGPVELETPATAAGLDRLLPAGRRHDVHVQVILEALRRQQTGGTP